MSQPHVILAGGASLSVRGVAHVARAKLENRCRVTAVNDAVYLAWWADALHAADEKWWLAHWPRVRDFPGAMTSLQPVPGNMRVRQLTDTGPDGFDWRPGFVRTGANSGYQAVHLAMQTNTKRIILLGFDMHGAHWHGGHPGEPQADFHSVMIPRFATLIEPARELGIEILNCSSNSALTCFPTATLREVI